ncbi:MAG: formate dehydrogenase subunit alpha [Dehalococcoidales bacterium]|nr:formate dehydrogenase subunit alpha [Dehalococcoidales bacterium]
MKEIALTINDRELKGRPGNTVLEVCKENGIYVPTLCHLDGLSDVGACRMCVVEIQKERKPVPACTYPIRDGLVVKTNTERLEKYRRQILELLLSEHEHNCLFCEKNGSCELQDLIYQYCIDRPIPLINKEIDPIDDSSPVILRDPNKCILCGRCVRACDEITSNQVLGFGNRGSKTFVTAEIKQLLGDTCCLACGACVQACPTGAITEKLSRFQGRNWDISKIETTCPYCGVGCQIELGINNNKIVKVRGVESGPDNMGHLCVKGRFGLDFVQHPDRLTTPLIKCNGEFREASWDEALDLVATKISDLKRKYGSDALAGLSSAKCSNEENYLFQKFVRACFGTNNVDHCARLCHASTVVGLAAAFGSGAMTNSIRDFGESKVILVIGSNTTENHPVIGDHIKRLVRTKKTKLIVADPRAIELTKYADIWLRQKGGTDVALLNGLMNVIINENLYDHEFVESRTENFEDFKKVVSEYTPERVENITGIPKDQLVAAARMYAEAESSSIVYSMGITQHTTGVDNVLSTANLAMLTGNIGRPGTGVNPLRGQCNVQGACDMGALPNVYQGYQSVANENIRATMENAWQAKLPEKPGLTVLEMMNQAEKGTLKAMYIMGENPMLSDPNLNHVKEALENLDFLVVQDIFLTETAKMADVVLPGVSFAEKDGTFTNTGRRIQRLRKAIPEVGQSRQDWEIIEEIGSRLGYSMSYQSPSDIMEEIASVTPSYGGVHYDRLDGQGLQWPCPTREHPGTPNLHKDKFTRGLGHFTPVEYRPPAELPDECYPFLLNTGRIRPQFHTGSMSRRSKGLAEIAPEGLLEMNPADGEKLNIADMDWVKVSSRRGHMETRVNITERVPEGTVFMAFHFGESAANFLTNDAVDPVAKIPEFKVAAVKIERLEKQLQTVKGS